MSTNTTEPDLTRDDGEKHANNMFIWALLAVFVTWAGSAYVLYPQDNVTRGTFGDMFGAVNSLFSGLAFATLIYAAIMQRMELRLQRIDLKNTRKELKRSAEAQELSEIALRTQADAAKRNAQLSATTALLRMYDEQLAPFNNTSTMFVDENTQAFINRLHERRSALLQILNTTYEELVTEFEQSGAEE